MPKIAVIVGSLRASSKNKLLARAIEAQAPKSTIFSFVDINELPLFNEELEASPPDSVVQARELVASADGVLIVSPEYNRGVPGPLKNAIDWLSRPSDRQVFRHKLVAIAGASGGKLGTAVAQSQLRQMLVYLDARVVGQPEVYVTFANDVFGEDGQPDDTTKAHLKRFIDSFTARIEDSK